MIYTLQKKLIRISGLSLLCVFFVMYVLIAVLSVMNLNATMHQLSETFPLKNDGHMDFDRESFMEKDDRKKKDFLTEETAFSTSYFTVAYKPEGTLDAVNMEHTYSVLEEEAVAMADEVLKKSADEGWISNFWFEKRNTPAGMMIVFVDGTMNRYTTMRTLLISGLVLIGSAAIVMILIIVFSKRAVKPIAESYEKQKQFITDANHELKTPLTLILANLDIAETEVGANEWLDDIRAESQRMSALVNQLVLLSRMDEDGNDLVFSDFDLSAAVSDTVSEFSMLAKQNGKSLTAQIEEGAVCRGDEGAIRRVVSILLDNAVKYCDAEGAITVTLSAGKRPTLCVENPCEGLRREELDRLFDRFYRSDKSRAYTGGFGIGLSIARAVVQRHRGEITAYQKDASRIGFRVVLKA